MSTPCHNHSFCFGYADASKRRRFNMKALPEWRQIPGFPNHEASNDGRVRKSLTAPLPRHIQHKHNPKCFPGYVLNQWIGPYGYWIVSLRINGERTNIAIHILVTRAFHGPPPPKHEVNHKNGNKRDNRPDNLEWVTRSQNTQHAHDLGLIKKKTDFSYVHRGEAVKTSKLKNADVLKIRELHAQGMTRRAIAAQISNISYENVCRVCSRKIWRHI